MDKKLLFVKIFTIVLFYAKTEATEGKKYRKSCEVILFVVKFLVNFYVQTLFVPPVYFKNVFIDCCEELQLGGGSTTVKSLHESRFGNYKLASDLVNKYKSYKMKENHKISIMYGTKQGWRVRHLMYIINHESKVLKLL